ncbi:MAG: hypothetical protein ACE5NC_01120 [Anaerolineae bacterium]
MMRKSVSLLQADGRWRKLLLFGVLAVAACVGPSPSPAPPGRPDQSVETEVVLIDIHEVAVHQVGFDPAKLEVDVQGVIGDSCNQLDQIEQRRDGGEVTITITAIRTVGVPCMELAQLYDDTIPLEGDFEPGSYTVAVNGVSDETEVVSHLGDAAAAARSFLAETLGVEESDLRLLSTEDVLWNDTSLGCPEPGKVYLQVITPGYRFTFQHGAERFEVHTNLDGTQTVTC